MSQMKNRDSNKGRREQRQFEAKVRQELASKRTPAERLANLPVGGAKKERPKLLKLVPAVEGASQPQPAAIQDAPKAKKAPKAARKAAKG